MSWRTRLEHAGLALLVTPGLVTRPSRRRLLRQMRLLCRQLPPLLKGPLPQAMAQLTAESAAAAAPLPGETTTRRLADLAALAERGSPLGLCLRRSLLRYYYLRQLQLPLVIRFGAKLTGDLENRDLAGHAWLTLDNQPYYEAAANWRGFKVMVSWPAAAGGTGESEPG